MNKLKGFIFLNFKSVLLVLLTLACSYSNTFAQKCILPAFAITTVEPSSNSATDGSFQIKNIYGATHYQILEGLNPIFDFKNAKALDPNAFTIDFNNIPNPPVARIFNFRLYNGNANCFVDQKIVYDHVNYLQGRDFTEIELLQAIDNPTPKIGDIVTFTTIVRNQGGQTSDNLEVNVIQATTLQSINYYAEKGSFISGLNLWKIGKLNGGASVKLVLRLKVLAQGLSYCNAYVSSEGTKKFSFSEAQAYGIEKAKRSATNCVSVPISITAAEVYTITLKQYKGVKWFYKDQSGNFSELNKNSNSAIAGINPDSSLTIRQSGEYSFSKKMGLCNITSCCPILIESCAGPTIVPDSVYCNSTVDSYNIVVHLENDKYNIIEKVFFAMSSVNFPLLTNYLSRLNSLPLTSSAGLVTSLGNGKYLISNIPAFMPNVTLVSTDLTGKCRNVRIVNAPNCTDRKLGMPHVKDDIQFIGQNQIGPAFSVINKEKNTDIVWFADEIGQVELHKGKKFRPGKEGTFYVAFRDKQTRILSPTLKVQLKPMEAEVPGKFDKTEVCDCDNSSMVPQGEFQDLVSSNAYPNPVSVELTIDYRIPKGSRTASIAITNINGRLIETHEVGVTTTQKKIDVTKWADGLYFYSLIIDGKRALNQKIVVMH
jgi:Domain of unknown function DUF11/Secretion system C-terminal sorting domain